MIRRLAQDVRSLANLHARIGLRPSRGRQHSVGGAKATDTQTPLTAAAIQPTCEIADFEPASDTLLCIWDDSTTNQPAPKLQLEADPEHTDGLRIRVGSNILARVQGKTAMTTADLAVMPLSSAQALGLAPIDGVSLQ